MEEQHTKEVQRLLNLHKRYRYLGDGYLEALQELLEAVLTKEK